MPTLTKENGLYVLHLGSDENRFTVAWVGEVEAALNTVVADPAPLVTIADGKFFSNGLDLDWMRANPTEASDYTARVKALLARFLTLPVATVAAVNGHAFGAGSLLATAHDWRVMRSDRGYFCFPEVDIKLPFGRGFGSLIQAKFTPRTALDAMSTGRRYGGEDGGRPARNRTGASRRPRRQGPAHPRLNQGHDVRRGRRATARTRLALAPALAQTRHREPANAGC